MFPHFVCLVMGWASFAAAAASLSPSEMQRISNFEIDRTEVSVQAFERFAQSTRFVSQAEREGGGQTFEGGWQKRSGWTWRSPFGKPASTSEPAVHLTQPEAAAFCAWAGKRLPTDAEWGEAAYTERREQPTDGFVRGRTYPFPTGDSPMGANCLGDCGSVKTVAHAVTSRGRGHSEVATSKRGVNGLYDMGGNVWEWVAAETGREPRTRGGSWWYGAEPMRDSHVQGKPAATAVVYIGFRCARDLQRP